MKLQPAVLESDLKNKPQKKSGILKWIVVGLILFFFLYNSIFGEEVEQYQIQIADYAQDTIVPEQYAEFLDKDIGYMRDLPINHEIIVAVVDTGVDYNHPELQDKMWSGVGYNFVDDNNDPIDVQTHGTNIALTIAGKYEKTRPRGGINPGAKIMAVRVRGGTENDAGTATSYSNGIRYAVDNGAHIINCSFITGNDHDVLRGAVEYAISNNVIVIAGAGNNSDDDVWYPAGYTNVITMGLLGITHVSGTPSPLQLDSVSTWGNHVDFATWKGVLGGTSGATAVMSGAISRLLAYDNTLTREEIYTKLVEFSQQLEGADNGKTKHGRVRWYDLSNSYLSREHRFVDVTIDEKVRRLMFEIVREKKNNAVVKKTLKHMINPNGMAYSIHKELSL